jgi:hypothetical protein
MTPEGSFDLTGNRSSQAQPPGRLRALPKECLAMTEVCR